MIASRLRRLAVPFALAALLAGCARPSGSGVWPSPSASAVPPASAVPSATALACPPDGVRFEVGEADAAMGLRVLGITLVNCGSRTYRLNGYPAVRSLGEDRAALPVRVLRGVREIVGSAMPWDGPPTPVVLRPGQLAGAAVAWRNTYDDIRQPPVTVAFLDIAPLPGRTSQVVEPEGGLDLGSTGRIGVSAWRMLPDSGIPTSPARPTAAGASSSEPMETGGPLP